MSDSLQPHGLQYVRLLCPLPLLKLMSIELVMSSNHLVLCRSSLFLPSIPESGSFPMSQLFRSAILQQKKKLHPVNPKKQRAFKSKCEDTLKPWFAWFFTWKFYFPELFCYISLFPLVCYFFLTHASRLSKKASKMHVFFNLHFWLFFAYIISFVLNTNDLFTLSNDPVDILN